MGIKNWLTKYFLLKYLLLSSYHLSNAFIGDLIRSVSSPFMEVCDKNWVPQDIMMLEYALSFNVFGQHIAEETILLALQIHVQKQHRQKPLVLSFHGWPGGGKGYIGNFIIKSFFKNGDRSTFVKKYIARNNFPLNSEVHRYQRQLQKDLEETISRCSKAVFLFDEVDKYPPHVLDGIKSYLDFSPNVNGHDFREAIFIFITNNGQKEITEITTKNYKNGSKREELELKDFEHTLKITAFNDQAGGFYKSDLIKHHLIDYVVPFLPLEREHVKLCIEAETSRFGLHPKDKFVSMIMEELLFGPEDFKLFSTNGCKNIAEKVAFHIAKIKRRDRRLDL